MTISAELRNQIRQHANFACEYCGVTETDAGGELTVDHYQPQAKGGADTFDNLRLLIRYHQGISLLEQIQAQHLALLEEHRQLLEEQRRLLRMLLDESERSQE